MGLTYYGSKISPNMTETPEGYLICLNVPVARVGEQKYLARELGIKDKDPNEMVIVNRTEEEVFSSKTIASFEGKPFTDNHPEEDVIPENYDLYQKGHCQNVHRGTGENQYNLVADIYVTNPNVIGEIKSGKRQISCGYTCNYVANEDGTYNQTNIQGNHIALVDEGRAGAKIRIMDSKCESQIKSEVKKMNNNVKNKFTSLLSMFARSVRDAKTNEEVDGLVSDAEQVMNGINETPEKKEEGQNEAPKVEAKDGEDMASIKNALLTASLALNSAIAYLTKEQDQPEKAPAVENKQEVVKDEEEAPKNVVKEEVKDCEEETKDCDEDDTLKSMDALTEELEGETKDDDSDNENKETEDDDEEEKKVEDDDDDELKTDDDDEDKSEVIESNTDDDDEEKQSEGYTKDAMAKFVKDMKPVIAQISNDRERQKVADMFARTFRKVTKDSNSLAKIIKANENYRSSKVSDSKPYTFEDRQMVFDRLNPHNHKK